MSTSFWDAVADLKPEQPKPVYFRLYYDKETNTPQFFSTEDLPGDYIDITKEQYNEYRLDYIVIEDGVVKERELLSHRQTFVHPCKDKKFTWILGVDSE